MERICPLCNCVSKIKIACSECGGEMEDKGRVQEFRDSYAPEDELEYENGDCRHVFQCDKCNQLKNVGIKSLYI